MKVLLDTCTILWAISAPDKLSKAAKSILSAKDTEVVVLPISSAEIACAVERKRVELNTHWKTWFRKYTEENEWNVLPISLEMIEEAYSLPLPFHKDPVDRMIVGAARILNAAIVTADNKMIEYPHVETIW